MIHICKQGFDVGEKLSIEGDKRKVALLEKFIL